jgi:hypothetical protein
MTVHIDMSQMRDGQPEHPYQPAVDYLLALGLKPTEDAVEQLALAFTPALVIMCERGGKRGQIWRQSGWRGALFEARKKLERLWYMDWVQSRPDPDSAVDLLNFIGFYMRSRDDDKAWGEYGEPGVGPTHSGGIR